MSIQRKASSAMIPLAILGLAFFAECPAQAGSDNSDQGSVQSPKLETGYREPAVILHLRTNLLRPLASLLLPTTIFDNDGHPAAEISDVLYCNPLDSSGNSGRLLAQITEFGQKSGPYLSTVDCNEPLQALLAANSGKAGFGGLLQLNVAENDQYKILSQPTWIGIEPNSHFTQIDIEAINNFEGVVNADASVTQSSLNQQFDIIFQMASPSDVYVGFFLHADGLMMPNWWTLPGISNSKPNLQTNADVYLLNSFINDVIKDDQTDFHMTSPDIQITGWSVSYSYQSCNLNAYISFVLKFGKGVFFVSIGFAGTPLVFSQVTVLPADFSPPNPSVAKFLANLIIKNFTGKELLPVLTKRISLHVGQEPVAANFRASYSAVSLNYVLFSGNGALDVDK